MTKSTSQTFPQAHIFSPTPFINKYLTYPLLSTKPQKNRHPHDAGFSHIPIFSQIISNAAEKDDKTAVPHQKNNTESNHPAQSPTY